MDRGKVVRLDPNGNPTDKPHFNSDVLPAPTDETLSTPEFNAVWDCIKTWDIAVPESYDGYMGAIGNHVQAILNAIGKAKNE